jgi:hypothetical protein
VFRFRENIIPKLRDTPSANFRPDDQRLVLTKNESPRLDRKIGRGDVRTVTNFARWVEPH